MAEAERYTNIIMGSGNGGMQLAWHLGRLGERTIVVERKWIGGACPNVNCLPTKNEIWSAKVAALARQGANFGVMTGAVTIDMARVRQRKRDMVDELRDGTIQLYKDSGAELLLGAGTFVAPKTLEVRLNDAGTRTLAGDRVVLDLGTHAIIPEIPGLIAAEPMTNIEALELDYAPEHLIVLGGGYVGLEMAQAFRRFGSRVTIVERGPHIAPLEDPDVAAEIAQIFENDGIDVLTSAETRNVQGRSGAGVTLLVRTAAGDKHIEATDILVGAGRTPNTAGLGLDVAGVELDERGFIKVNERLETTAPDVWGIGECCSGNPQFTHVSHDDARIIAANLAGGHRTRSDRVIPYCMFTDPPLAHIGLNEGQAKQRGIDVRVIKLPMSGILRAHTTGELQGFMKALIGDDDQILGFTMIGSEAGEVLATVQMTMLARLPYTALRDAVIAHPTMAEGLNGLFSLVSPMAAAAL